MPYSGISDANLPDAIKKKPAKIRKIFVSTFNDVHKKKGEEAAFKAAYAAVKKAEKKKKKTKEDVNMILTEDQRRELVPIREWDLGAMEIQEAKSGKDGNYIMTFIKEGWSKNGYYWGRERLEEINEMIDDSAKMYLNHVRNTKKGVILGRDMRDWAAQIETHQIAQGNDGKARIQGEVHIFEKLGGCPDGFLRERVSKFPGEVGSSVDTWCKISEGEKEGRKGKIIEKVAFLESNDFVTRASAGGGIEKRVGEAEFQSFQEMFIHAPEGSYESLIYRLAEAARDNKKLFGTENEWMIDIFGTFPDKVLVEVGWGKGKLYQANWSEKDNGDFEFSEVKEIEVLFNPKEGENGAPTIKDEGSENIAESVVDTQNTKDFLKKKGGLDTMFNVTEYNEWKTQNPEFLNHLYEELKEKMAVDEKVARIDEIEKELEKSQGDLTSVTEERDTLATENDNLKAEKKVREDKEAEEAHNTARDKMIGDSGIPEEYVTEIFRKNVRKAETDEEAQAEIDDRKKIVESESGQVRGNGPIGGTRTQESGGDDDEKKKEEIDNRIKERLNPNRR